MMTGMTPTSSSHYNGMQRKKRQPWTDGDYLELEPRGLGHQFEPRVLGHQMEPRAPGRPFGPMRNGGRPTDLKEFSHRRQKGPRFSYEFYTPNMANLAFVNT